MLHPVGIKFLPNGDEILSLKTKSLSYLSKKFLEACNYGNVHEVKECIKKGVDINVKDDEGTNAAMIAMKNKNIEVMKILRLENTMEWKQEDKHGQTIAFWYAFQYSNDFAALLKDIDIEQYIDWNHQNKEGHTVSMQAAYYDQVDFQNELIKKENIKWNLQDYNGCTTAIYAVKGGSSKCVQTLSQKEGIDWNLYDREGNTALLLAAKSYENSMAKIKNWLGAKSKIVEDIIEENFTENCAFVKIIQILLKKEGIDWKMENGNCENALKVVMRNRQLFLVVYNDIKTHVSKLMNSKFYVTEITKTPIIFALENNLEDHIIQILLNGAKSHDIVDLILYSKLYTPRIKLHNLQFNQNKKIKLEN